MLTARNKQKVRNKKTHKTMNTLKTETLNHLTIVASQINKEGAFEHFEKMVSSNLPSCKLIETLAGRYNVSLASLDYLFKGSEDDCLESSLLIATKCDELRIN